MVPSEERDSSVKRSARSLIFWHFRPLTSVRWWGKPSRQNNIVALFLPNQRSVGSLLIWHSPVIICELIKRIFSVALRLKAEAARLQESRLLYLFSFSPGEKKIRETVGLSLRVLVNIAGGFPWKVKEFLCFAENLRNKGKVE